MPHDINNLAERIPGLVAVGGGIGSGKSVVCRILRILGHEVYDCDSRAREIMDCNNDIIDAIKLNVCPEAIVEVEPQKRKINRRILADAVFSDQRKLRMLNSIVHSAVISDTYCWSAEMKRRNARKPIFVESAIIVESGLDNIVTEIWEVESPESVRYERINRRDRLDGAQIQQRIEAQRNNLSAANAPIRKIVNDNTTALLPQIFTLLSHNSSWS